MTTTAHGNLSVKRTVRRPSAPGRSTRHHHAFAAAVATILALILAGSVAVPSVQAGQDRQAVSPDGFQLNPGRDRGDLDFPISWKRYYTYAEWTKIMHDLQKRYPQLADVRSIGKSRMGRDQYLLTITAKSTGAAESKAAVWVDGAIHGNEVNGITCSLYLAWTLLTRYEYDRSIHRLLDERAFYILPGLNVDANESYVAHPNTENNPREPYRPEDDDGDGLYDEDQTEDVDGDGELSMMYVEDARGDYKLSPDKRRFVRVDDPREEVRRFRRIGPEGFDNDGDGRLNEDDIGGPDPNRNMPYGWTLQAGWPYPMSEVETRNVFEFQRAHPNIFVAFHYHNTGRLIMFSAPNEARALSAEERQRRDEAVSTRLAEMRKADKYAQLFSRTPAPELQHDMDVQTAVVTEGARILKDYRPTISGLSGQAQASSYHMLGAYAYLIELWGIPASEADLDGDGRVSDDEFIAWIDRDVGADAWITPHTVKHPDLGEVWIGGTARKHVQRTPPGRYMEEEALRNSTFVLYCASQMPRVEIEGVDVVPAAGDLFWVECAVANDRAYPTVSDMNVKLKQAVLDRISVKAAGGVEVIGLPDGTTAIEDLHPAGGATAVGTAPAEFRLRARETKLFRTLVRVRGAGSIEFSVESKAGGKASRTVPLKTGAE